MPPPPPSRKKNHKTLSDLLADDVRDYLSREQQPITPQRSRTSGAGGNRRSNHRGAPEQPARSSSSPSVSSGKGSSSSFRAGWTASSSAWGGGGGTPSSASSTSPYSVRTADESDNKVQQRYDPIPEEQRQTSNPEEQFRGQHTAERHGSNDSSGGGGGGGALHAQSSSIPMRRRSSGGNSTGSFNNRSPTSLSHRRHGSGSGSFHSRGSVSTAASRNSKNATLSAADAEFLRRYAEEKERTNLRMLAARPNSNHGMPEMHGAPNANVVFPNPYHSLLTSPRPPTVTGSHRPGLPSIDNDDWEEDDRIERRDRRKMERKEARKLERYRQRTSSGSVGGDSISIKSRQGSVVYSREESPIPRLGRNISAGSAQSAGQYSVAYTPGSEHYKSESSTLCYSTGSSQHLAGAFPPEMPFGQHHMRGDSAGTFVRSASGTNLKGFMGDGGGVGVNGDGHGRYLHHESSSTMSNGGHSGRNHQGTGTEKKKGHVRPLSYLSASSNSDKSGEPLLPDEAIRSYSDSSPSIFGLGDRSRSTSTNCAISSPYSSSSGGTFQPRHHPFQVPDLMRQSSTDQSDLHSMLLGSALIDSKPSGESMTPRNGARKGINGTGGLGGGGGRGGYRQYQQRSEDEDSSDGSYDSDDSSESSYSSDSYDGGSSSNSHTSSERRGPPSRYQNSNPNAGAKWEPVKFSVSDRHAFDWRDVEGGMHNENDHLANYGPNYSSLEPSYKSKSRNKRNNRAYSRTFLPRQNRLGGRGGAPLRLDDAIEVILGKMNAMLVMLELFISNMPSLVGSLALAWVSMGVDWFKWYEETFDACHPTHYHNSACVFTEFPGCFACETDSNGYQFWLHFHYLCSTIAFILSSFLVGKIIIAFPVMRDELANPTTAAPLGLVLMAFEKVFAGNFGYIGKGITFIASALHTAVAAWFIFISAVYKTLPEPSWFSNTTGIGLAAAKTYLYWTGGGYFLSGVSLLAFSMFYVVALYRIHTNEKISVPVCWVQLSGPAVVLYGFTIFSQPGSDSDDFALLIQENKENFYQIHRRFYMPVMNILFTFCMVSMASSLYLLRTRWKAFRDKEFSPAHVSFAAPLISHANAMQAYRSSLNKFSPTPPGTLFKIWLYRYWTLTVICGTVLVFVMTWKFLAHLPSWCQIDVEDDELPPAPDETLVTQLLQQGEAGDEMKQNFVSAAVLQANESGTLVRVLQDGKMKYVRSRRMPSMGFDPIMNFSELMSERERLLQHVTYAADPSRDRGGMRSFDDDIHFDTLHEPQRLRASSGRRKLNFLSFDASTMMRPS